LDEVDDASILKTGLHRPLSMPSQLVTAPSDSARRSGLLRSDLVLWPSCPVRCTAPGPSANWGNFWRAGGRRCMRTRDPDRRGPATRRCRWPPRRISEGAFPGPWRGI